MARASELVGRLRHLVSLNETKNGGPYGGYAAQECVSAMDEAASAIERLEAELTSERNQFAELLHKIAVADTRVQYSGLATAPTGVEIGPAGEIAQAALSALEPKP